MTGFSETWLAEHNAKMAVIRAEALPPMPDTIEFFLQYLTKLPNNMPLNKWAATSERKKLFRLMEPFLYPYVGRIPHQQAEVHVTRLSVGDKRPDPDNNMASLKRLIDLLLVKSAVHPDSFGIIADDDQANLRVIADAERVHALIEQGTRVVIRKASW